MLEHELKPETVVCKKLQPHMYQSNYLYDMIHNNTVSYSRGSVGLTEARRAVIPFRFGTDIPPTSQGSNSLLRISFCSFGLEPLLATAIMVPVIFAVEVHADSEAETMNATFKFNDESKTCPINCSVLLQ